MYFETDMRINQVTGCTVFVLDCPPGFYIFRSYCSTLDEAGICEVDGEMHIVLDGSILPLEGRSDIPPNLDQF